MLELPKSYHRFAQASGIRTHHVRAGRGAPLILLHGWPEYWRAGRKTVGPLSRDHEAIAWDYRGCADAEKPQLYDMKKYAFQEYVNDRLGLADALGRPECRPSPIVYGKSQDSAVN